MFKSNDVEFHQMTPVVHEMVRSFRNEPDKWTIEMLDPQHNDESFSFNHLLVVSHEDSEHKFLISSNPLHFFVDMNTVFDVVDELPPTRYLVKLFSKTQKETLYSEFVQCFNPNESIVNSANDKGLELRPFRCRQQKDIFDLFLDGKRSKFPTL